MGSASECEPPLAERSSRTAVARAASGSLREPRTRDGRVGQVWRIRDRATFAALRGPGARSSRSGTVRVSFVPAAAVSLPEGRIAAAFGVSRKVGGAVVRNRLRRRCRAVLQAAARSESLPGGAYLVSLSPGAAMADPALLRRQLRTALAEASG